MRLIVVVFIGLIVASVVLFYLPAQWYSGYRNNLENLEEEAGSLTKEEQGSENLTRCGHLPGLYPDSIPPIVHWTSKDGRVLPRIQPLIKSWRLLLQSSSQAEWKFMHWSDKQLYHLISKHYPFLLSSYNKLVNGLERSDIGRLVVLHHVGGVYVDMDVELRRDLSPWLNSLPTEVINMTGVSRNVNRFTAVWSQEPPEHAIFHFDLNRLIANSVILSRPNHSFLSYVLREWPGWFEKNWAKNRDRHHGYAVRVTGPLMINSFYENYLTLSPADRPADWSGTILVDANLFQPIWDVMYIPSKLRHTCIRQLSELSELKKRHCQRLSDAKFRTRRVPHRSYTVHRYMHLSYSSPRLDFQRSKSISSLLPLLNCKI